MDTLRNWSESSCRVNLREADLKFLKFVLAPEGYGMDVWDRVEHDLDMRDRLLDDPALLKAILNYPGQLPISSSLYFYILLRKAFLEVGIDDRDIVDYLVAVLVRRLHVDGAFNHTISDGKTYFYITECLQKIEQAELVDQFLLRVKLANQALFLTGLFGEHLRYREQRRGAPNIRFYEAIGGAQYRAARDYKLADELKLRSIFELLGTAFPVVRMALNVMSDRFISLGDPFWGNAQGPKEL